MANPIVAGVLDRVAPSVYTLAEVATLTVTYSDPDAKSSTITVTGTDAEGHAAFVTVGYSVTDPVTLVVSDDSGRVWVKQTDNGSTAVYKTTI